MSTSRPSWLRLRSMYRRALLGLLRLTGALLCSRLVDGPDVRVSHSLDGSEVDAAEERAPPDLLKPDSDFSMLHYCGRKCVTSQQNACCRLAASVSLQYDLQGLVHSTACLLIYLPPFSKFGCC